MATYAAKTPNFLVELKKSKAKGNNPRIYMTLLDSEADIRLVEIFAEYAEVEIAGFVDEPNLYSCRNKVSHDSIRNTIKNSHYPSFSSSVLADESGEIFLVTRIDINFVYLIENYFNSVNVDCTIFNIYTMKNRLPSRSLNGLLPIEEGCSGCGLCSKVCPVGAIAMGTNKDTYRVPVIDSEKCIRCGKCSTKCPTLNTEYTNRTVPPVYSANAQDEIRAKSTSGGMFTVLAEYVLAKGGVVCGAVMDKHLQVKHVFAESVEELEQLRGSKYIQSDIADCYIPLENYLKEDRYVLFVGTPCQVAAVKSFVGKEYDKLITAEVLCKGAPSQTLFDKYMEKHPDRDKMVQVRFRDKKYGWGYSVVAEYESGNTSLIGKFIPVKTDPYLYMFLRESVLTRKICYDCMFANFPRQADLTIGDLWNSDVLDPECNDQKGSSMVFINNDKGEKVFEEIKETLKYHKLLKIDNLRDIPNRVTPKRKINPKRELFLDMLHRKTFLEAHDMIKSGKFDIGMPCVLLTNNIGSMLTYFALFNVLRDMGYAVLPIECPKDSKFEGREDATVFVKKWLPEYAFPVKYANVDEMRKLNRICDSFVVGSDQIFLESMGEIRKHIFMLEWAEDSKRKVSYASSFGGPGARGTEDYYRRLKYALNRFDYVSCREDDGVKLANNEIKLNKHVDWVIDPVFLCDKNYYLKLIDSVSKPCENDYIGGYILKPRASSQNVLAAAQKAFPGLDVTIVGEKVRNGESAAFKYALLDPFPVERTLSVIYHSKMFVTDSFHGVCFAIIFRKDFVVCPRDFFDRFDTLLGRLGLRDRIVSPSETNISPDLFKPIDYDAVYEKLDRIIAESREKLVQALKIEKAEGLTDTDVLTDKLLEIKNADSDTAKLLAKVMERLAKVEAELASLKEKKDSEVK